MEDNWVKSYENDIMFLEATGDEEAAQSTKNELIIYKLFPDARFNIDHDFIPILDDLLTEEKHIFLSNHLTCYCYDGLGRPNQEFYEIKGDRITYRYVLNELIKQDFHQYRYCSHSCLEMITPTTNIQFDLCMGS
jgi:hypothetical protein